LLLLSIDAEDSGLHEGALIITGEVLVLLDAVDDLGVIDLLLKLCERKVTLHVDQHGSTPVTCRSHDVIRDATIEYFMGAFQERHDHARHIGDLVDVHWLEGLGRDAVDKDFFAGRVLLTFLRMNSARVVLVQVACTLTVTM